jgi:serine/threonine protein kinase
MMNDSVPASPVGDPLSPQIPDHELIRRVGSGAFGEVWKARSQDSGILVAVKILFKPISASEVMRALANKIDHSELLRTAKVNPKNQPEAITRYLLSHYVTVCERLYVL